MRARKIILKNYFDGAPTLTNFELVEETIPETLEDRGKPTVKIHDQLIVITNRNRSRSFIITLVSPELRYEISIELAIILTIIIIVMSVVY
jgi:hypothetical protein